MLGPEPIPVIDGASLTRGSNEAAVALGSALHDYGVALVDVRSMRLEPPEIDDGLRSLASGDTLHHLAASLFARVDVLAAHSNRIRADGVENGYYTFPLNSFAGGLRALTPGPPVGGLPWSLVWNHPAVGWTKVPAIASIQQMLDRVARAANAIASAAVLALEAWFDDRRGTLRTLTGAPVAHGASHLKLIASPAAPVDADVAADQTTGLVCRHRPHVDHCVLTVIPSNGGPSSGGRLHYLAQDGEGWHALYVPDGHVALFGGLDLATWCSGSPRAVRGLPHQVLAIHAEARRPRYSLLFRLTVDPDLMATRRSRRGSRALCTTPMPPLPTCERISYGPRRVPALSVMGDGHGDYTAEPTSRVPPSNRRDA